VEATELTEEAILDAVRAGRISFPRHGMEIGPFLYRTSAVVLGQRRYIGRWVAGRLRRGAGR
jgi:hypothetical protein